MSIKSIRIENLLSFDSLLINQIEDINCIIGINNSGKSNLLKLIRFFYTQLNEQKELHPDLFSNYSTCGIISIKFDMSHIMKIVTSYKNMTNPKQGYFKEIESLFRSLVKNDTFELTLKINKTGSVKWNVDNKKVRQVIADIYPFFDIETRHINLYNWGMLWNLISRLKPFNPHKIDKKQINKFFDEELSKDEDYNYNNYGNYIKLIEKSLETRSYNYREKVLNYVKTGLTGHSFVIQNEALEIQSDGTNSHIFLESFISLLITLTRKAYVTPVLYIDEPEIGLHPKLSEEFIENIYNTYAEKQHEKTPYPKIIFSTHSPNILKLTIKLFGEKQQVLHFSKLHKKPTKVQKMNSQYNDIKFLNVFGDSEARLFFSNFILFVEGATELEIFQNRSLQKIFPHMKKIDVYATNELVLKYINPAYANTSIPYLVLYDADKIIDVNYQKISLKNHLLDFNQLKKSYAKAYIGSPLYSKFIAIKNFFTKANLPLTITDGLFIDNLDFEQLIKEVNTGFLNQENYFLNKTTVEEVLINKKSFRIFVKWLIHEYRTKVNIRDTKNANKMIQSFKIKYPKQNNLFQTFNSIFEYKESTATNVTAENIRFAYKIKNRYRKLITKTLQRQFHDDKIHLVFLLLFNGKSETLIGRENSKFKSISKNNLYKIYLEHLSKYLRIFDIKFTKTSGWATEFLNFAFEDIIKNSQNKDIEACFKNNFREFYDIITLVKKKL